MNYPKTYNPCDKCDFNGVSSRAMCECCEFELARIKTAKKSNEWIPVEERLPEEGVEVIVALQIGDRLAVDTDRIHGREWFAYGKNGYRSAGYITHWMPLPEAPKGGDK